jgi:EAL domain-containing protein (putative c-di-GMP-specific phosphodiesterase class I)
MAAWELLDRMGCDDGQGYFISRPMPAEQFGAWLNAWQAPRGMDARASLPAGAE